MSRILTVPFLSTSRLAGLMSRWTMPCSWAYCKPSGRLDDVIHGLGDGQRTFLLDDGGEVLAVDVLHHQIMPAFMLARIVGGDDVGMLQLGGGLDLTVKPFHGIGRLQGRARIIFTATMPLHAAMLGLEHHAHAALAELVQHHVFAEDQPLGLPW